MRAGLLAVLALAAVTAAAPLPADERHPPGVAEGEERGDELYEPEEMPPEIVPDPADEDAVVPGAPDPLDGEAPLPPPEVTSPRSGPAQPAAPVQPLGIQ